MKWNIFPRQDMDEPHPGEEESFDEGFLLEVSAVVAALVAGGYDPFTQLTCFLKTGNARYITREEDARSRAAALDREQLGRYLEQMKGVGAC